MEVSIYLSSVCTGLILIQRNAIKEWCIFPQNDRRDC